MCSLCEEYTTKALEYIKQNKTDQEIIDTLHNTCSQLHSFKQKVDHLFKQSTCSQLLGKSTLVSLCALYGLICFFCIAQCIDLVDYYTPIFLSEVASLKPREFCHEINICQLVEHVSLKVQEDACGFCEETVSTLLDKLKDSDTKVSNFIFLL